MKTTPPTFRRVCLALVMAISAPWASGQLVQTLKDINTMPVAPVELPDAMTLAGGTLYISTDNALAGTELWKYTVLAQFTGSTGVVADAAGNLYVLDTPNHVIRKVTTTGLVTTFAGTLGLTGNIDGAGISARFNSPQAIAIVDSGPNVGTLFVADTGNSTIRRISPEGVVTTAAGKTTGSGLNRVGDPGYINANGTDAQFRSPRGVAVRLPAVNSTNLQVWVSDSGNNVIRRITINANASGVITSSAVDTFAGQGTVPQDMPPNGEGSPAGSTDASGNSARFNNPGGLALDLAIDLSSGQPTLYVADTGNNKIRRVALGGQVTTLAGSGAAGSANATGAAASFNAPQGVSCDSGATVTPANVVVFVADTGNHLIRRIQASTGVVTTLAGTTGTAGSADGATGAASSFNAPRGVAFRRVGTTTTELFVADTGNHTIRRVVVPSGSTTLRAGQTGLSGSLDGGATGTPTASPVQVKDILPGEQSGSPEHLTAMGNNIFFSAEGEAGDRDLWWSDGTSANTRRVASSVYPSDPPGPLHLTAVGNNLFFQGYSFDEAAELWKISGTPGVSGVPEGAARVKDINIGPDSSLLENFFSATINGVPTLLFGATTLVPMTQETPAFMTGVELWRSQGADDANTTLVRDMFTGTVGSNPGGYTFFNDNYYFAATSNFVDEDNPNPVGRELFKLPATFPPASPPLVEDMLVADLDGIGDSEPRELTVSGPNLASAGGQLFFTASTASDGRELYVINSDSLTPTQVVNLDNGGADSGIEHLTAITIPSADPSVRQNRVLFTGNAGGNLGLELYSSDGTAVNTDLVQDITPGEESSVLDHFFALSPGLVVFTKQEADESLTLWRTDGSNGGTVQIDDFKSEGDTGDSVTAKDFRAAVRIGTNLYFMLSDDELWRTNGLSDEGTVKLHNFRTSTESSNSQGFTLSNGKVIFSATTPEEGRELWVSDLVNSTTLLADLRPGPDGSEPENLTASDDGRVFFTAEAVSGNRELFWTDGTTITQLGEINASEGSNPHNLFWHKEEGKLYFAATASGSDTEVWVLSGADSLTNVAVNPTAGGSFPDNFTALKGFVYFSAETSAGVELWRTNGITTTAAPFMDIASGTQSSDPDEFVVFPATGATSKLYFIANGSGNGATAAQETGRELWVTDGTATPTGVSTATATKVVKDIIPGGIGSISPSFPAYLTVAGNLMYFVADDGVNGRELWKSNGTAGGTVMVTNINKIADSGTNTLGSNPTELRDVNGKLFFLADDGVNGRELWTSDGTVAGTRMISAPNRTGLVTGLGDAAIQEMVVVRDVLTFTADDGVSGREVWITDGTTQGTRILTEFVLGAGSSYPHNLAAVSSQLLFAASDVLIGDEPRQAFLSSRLVVQRPPATEEFVSNVTVLDFTPVTPLASSTKPTEGFADIILRLRNPGSTGITKLVASISGLHAADFTITKKPNGSIAAEDPLRPPTFTELTIRFKPREGGDRTAQLLISSTDVDNPLFIIPLSGDATKDPTVGTQPISQMVKVGAPFTLTATTANGSNPITLQWRKNAGNIAGATSNPFYLWAAKLTDAGAYTAQFKSTITLTPLKTSLGTSDIAQIGVVEDFVPARVVALKASTLKTVGDVTTVTASTKLTLTVNAAGNNLTYRWKRSFAQDLSDPQELVTVAPANAPLTTVFAGVTTKTLTGAPIKTDDIAFYFCEVTGPGGMKVGGTTFVKVFNAPPVVTPLPGNTLPVGIVGTPYYHQIEYDLDTFKAPTGFKVTGLFGGLKYDTKTGIISGVPTGVGEQPVTITVTNEFKYATGDPQLNVTTAMLKIVAVPAGLDGVFQGLVGRDMEINGSAGGRIEITVTKLGTYSGKLIMGPTTYPFKGSLMLTLNAGVAAPPYNAMVRIPRTGILSPLDLSFTIEPNDKNTLSAGQITSVNVGGPVTAEVYAWKVTTNTARYLGLHNFGIRLAAGNVGNAAVPQGDGYGSFNVSTKGVLTIAGMTADGEKITCATHVGPNGEVLLYQSLYTTARKGAIAGLLTLGTGVLIDDPTDNIITTSPLFDFAWTRPPATAVLGTAANTRTYRAGFGLADTPVTAPVELEAFGGYYAPPGVGAHLLQIPAGSSAAANASIAFTEAGVDLPGLPTSREPDVSLAINGSVVKIATTPPPPTNFAMTKVTTPVAKTGLFTGSFVFENDDPTTTTPAALNNKANEIKRTVSFLGLIVPEAGNHRGVGYFMLQQIPPAPGATPYKTAPILSGKVDFDND